MAFLGTAQLVVAAGSVAGKNSKDIVTALMKKAWGRFQLSK